MINKLWLPLRTTCINAPMNSIIILFCCNKYYNKVCVCGGGKTVNKVTQQRGGGVGQMFTWRYMDGDRGQKVS